MPYGLTNAPAVFQALLNDVLRDFVNDFVSVYLENIPIYSQDAMKHSNHVCAILPGPENQLFIKTENCKFHVSPVSFLSFIFDCGQVGTDPENIKAVAEWPIPKDQKQLQCFLGFVKFYK